MGAESIETEEPHHVPSVEEQIVGGIKDTEFVKEVEFSVPSKPSHSHDIKCEAPPVEIGGGKDVAEPEVVKKECNRTSITHGIRMEDVPLGSCLGFVRDMPTLLGTKQFMHMGVFIGNGERVKSVLKMEKAHDDIDVKGDEHYIIHLWHPDHKEHAKVRMDAISRVGEGTPIVVVELVNHTPGTLEEIEGRAISKMGDPGFNMLLKSCQQFATWVRYGDRINIETEGAIKGLFAPTMVLGGLALGVIMTPFVPFAVAAYTACGVAGAAGMLYVGSPVHQKIFVKNMEITPIDYSTPLRERQSMSEQLC